jgi:hypothetical protein
VTGASTALNPYAIMAGAPTPEAKGVDEALSRKVSDMSPRRRTFSRLIAAAALVVGVAVPVIVSPAAHADVAPVQIYPVPSIYPASTDYRLAVNGESVPVTHYSGYDIAQFAMSAGSAEIAVTKVNKTTIGAYSISPKKLNLVGTVSGPTLTFTVPNDEYLIVKLDGRPNLVIAIDPAETNRPASTGDGVFDVTAAPYSAQPGAEYATTAFQTALDDASAWGTANGAKGTVYVPAGVWTVGNLFLGSDLALYLEPGAVLRYTGERAHYTAHGHKKSQNRDTTWFLSTRFSSKNVSIYGRGVVDGNGMASLKPSNLGVNLLVPVYTEGFSVDGITFRESSSWAIMPQRSANMTFTNLKIFNRFDMGENDGIDVMESTNVRVTHAIGIALDDPFSTKTWDDVTDLFGTLPGAARPLDDVVFDDLVSWTFCYAVKVGQGVVQPQSNVTFRHVVVYDAAVAIGVHHKYGTAPIRSVTFDDVDVERLSFSNDGNRTWLALFMAAGAGAGPIDQVTVSNVLVRNAGTSPARINGQPDIPITGVTLSHIVMPGATEGATTLADMKITNTSDLGPVTITP